MSPSRSDLMYSTSAAASARVEHALVGRHHRLEAGVRRQRGGSIIERVRYASSAMTVRAVRERDRRAVEPAPGRTDVALAVDRVAGEALLPHGDRATKLCEVGVDRVASPAGDREVLVGERVAPLACASHAS